MSPIRRNVLVVAPFLPYPPDFGGALRVYHLICGLQRQHDVHLVVLATPAEAEHVRTLGEICNVTAVPTTTTARETARIGKRAAQLASMASGDSYLARSLDVSRLQAVIDRIFLTQYVDLMQLEFTQTALVRPTRPVPTVIDAHNIENELLKRVARTDAGLGQMAFNLLEWRKVRRLEERLWRTATIVTATSERDAAAISRVTERPAVVVPNGVDVSAYANIITPRRSDQVVFIGAMRHYPNAEGARWYAERVHSIVRRSIPDATLMIVGADPPADVLALASDSIVITGRVDRVEPYLSSSAVAIVPLHAGGGTRLKILEAFAAQTPVVSTTVGAEGIDVEDGIHLLIRDRPEEFAAAVVALLRNVTPPGYSTDHGLQLAQERYDWGSVVVPRLLDAHDRALAVFAHCQSERLTDDAGRT